MINISKVPDWLDRFVHWGSDKLNPLLVRSIRQNLRNRTFLAVFFLLLGIGGLTCVMVASSGNVTRANSQAGLNLFIYLSWLWGAGIIIVQSLSAYRAVIIERQDDTWDLVELTTLEPRHIIRGLLLTALVQGIMFTSALAPFMVMAYMLRGLNIWIILLTFLLIPAVSLSACAISILCACLTNKKGTRAFLGLVSLVATVWIYFPTMAFISTSYSINRFIEEFLHWDQEIIGGLAVAFNIWIVGNLMMLIFSASLLKHKAANRSTGPRGIWMFAYLNLIIATLIFGPMFYHGDYHYELLLIPAVIGVFATALLGLFGLSEHYRLTPRQDRDIKHPKRWIRSFMFMVGPGAARGRIAYIFMSFITFMLAFIAYMTFDTGYSYTSRTVDRLFTFVWTSLCFTSITLLISDYLYRNQLRKFFDTPALRRAFALTFFAVINIIPFIIIVVLDNNGISTGFFEIITPLYGIFKMMDRPDDFFGYQLALAILGLASFIILFYQAVMNYHYQQLRTVAGDGDRNPRAG